MKYFPKRKVKTFNLNVMVRVHFLHHWMGHKILVRHLSQTLRFTFVVKINRHFASSLCTRSKFTNLPNVLPDGNAVHAD